MKDPNKCVHPLAALRAKMVKEEMYESVKILQTYLRCELCGHESVMVSFGHKASEEEQKFYEQTGRIPDPQSG